VLQIDALDDILLQYVAVGAIRHEAGTSSCLVKEEKSGINLDGFVVKNVQRGGYAVVQGPRECQDLCYDCG